MTKEKVKRVIAPLERRLRLPGVKASVTSFSCS